MQYNRLGRTNLNVSAAGLGCGGHSKLGLSKNLGEDNAIKIVKTALDLGINFFDTSAVYGTEEVLGKGLLGKKRDDFVISTKFPPTIGKNELKADGALTQSLDTSLRNMGLDYIDIFNLHGVMPDDYINARDKFMPELIKAKEAGKIGWFGITEMFSLDTNHSMQRMSVDDNIWDVIMLGLNIMNPAAIKTLLPTTMKNDIGTMVMFAVRTALSQKKRLLEIMDELCERKEVDPKLFSADDPLDFLVKDGVATSVMDAAYRFCSHTKGIDAVFTGTSSVDHLKDNVASILSPALPDDTIQKIMDIFGNVDSVSAQ